MWSSLGVSTTGSTSNVLTERGVFVPIPDRVLQVTQLEKKPESFDIVSGIANGISAQTLVTGEIFGFPAASRYATLNVDIVWQALESHVITLDNLTRFLITGLDDSTNLEISNQTGLIGVRYAAATQHESIAFIFDSEANRDAFVTLTQPIFGGLTATSNSFRFQLDYEVENDLGGFADINNALYCRNGADILGTTTTDILRSRGCVELFNRASDIYTPNVTGTSRGTTTEDIIVNNSGEGIGALFTIGGIDLSTITAGNYIYFSGFPTAGVLKRGSFVVSGTTLPLVAWGEFADVDYGDQFTNGHQEVIPSGTQVFEVTEAQLELLSYDANVGLIVEPDLFQVHTSQVRLLDLPTSDPGGEGFLYTQTGSELGFTGAAATQKFVLQS